ncbi:MAG: hypothetical protein QGG40_06490, partial [Myxococcota bacterium]|nr:hypothetical protein [Myxococcota bacterium]
MGRRHTASQLSVGLALLCGGWLAGCGDKADDSGEPVAPDVTLATCDEPVGGIPWDDAAPYESDTGLQVELAAMDFGELDETLDISELISFYRGFIAFALDVPPESLGDTLDRDEVLAMGPMGEVVLGSIIEGGSLGFDFTFYRR